MKRAKDFSWHRRLCHSLQGSGHKAAKTQTGTTTHALLIAIAAATVMSATSCSCNNNKQTEEENTVISDSMQAVRSITAEDSLLLTNANAASWIEMSLHNYHNNWHRFELQDYWYPDSNSIKKQTFAAEKDFYKNYAPVLKWNVDSSYILDIGSYNTVPLKDKQGNVKLAAGEPDTRVSFIYPKTKERSDILFNGPGTTVLDARWLDSTQVAMLAAVAQDSTDVTDTLMWIIDARENFFRKYKWD